jgi:hypothetical protein
MARLLSVSAKDDDANPAALYTVIYPSFLLLYRRKLWIGSSLTPPSHENHTVAIPTRASGEKHTIESVTSPIKTPSLRPRALV